MTSILAGLPRVIPLLGIQDESEPKKVGFIASNWGKGNHPAWYYNLKANPEATISIVGQTGNYLAQSALGIHKGYSLYQERAGGRHIPIMIMTPVET